MVLDLRTKDIASVLLMVALFLTGVNSCFAQAAQPGKTDQPYTPPSGNPSNPTGFQIGVVDPNSGASIPPELQELAKMGAMAASEGRLREARESFAKMVAKAPNNALAHANLGSIDYQLGNYESARKNIRRSLQLNPKVSDNWLTMGLIEFKEGHIHLAISTLARAIHEEPRDPRAHLYMGVVARANGWGDAAEVEIRRALELDPKYADAHFNLSLIYLEREPAAYELAKRHYYTAIDLGTKPEPLVEERLKAAEQKAASESTN